jgi:histidinol-phosphate aminotransferase
MKATAARLEGASMSDNIGPRFNDHVRSLPSSTPFVAPEALERQRGRRFSARLGANESLFGPSPSALDAMRNALNEIGLYGDPENAELRSAIAARERAEPEQIIVGAGIDDLLGLFVRILMNPGDHAVASAGSYPTFAYHIAGYGASLETAPYRDYRNDLDALADAARRVNARIVYLANPDNPTGSYYAGSDILAFMGRLPDTCALLLDEAYIQFAPSDAQVNWPIDDKRLIRLRTFSKAYGMAGARIGYAIASAEVAHMADKVRLHFGVSRVAQAGALAALDDQEYLDGVVREVRQGREEYAILARDLGLATLPSATNFVAMDAGSPDRGRMIVRELAERDVFVRAPAIEGLNQLVRITVGDAERRAQLAVALREACAVTQHLLS